MKYKLIDYFDVWGNPEDGWEVNNLCTVKENIEIPENATDAEILVLLVDIGFLATADERLVCLESADSSFIEVYQVKDMFPLGRLIKENV